MEFLCCNIDTIANAAVAIFALVAPIQTTKSHNVDEIRFVYESCLSYVY